MISALSSAAYTAGTMAAWAAVPQANLAGTTKMTLWYFAVNGTYEIEVSFDTAAYRFKAEHNANQPKTSTSSLVYNVDGGEQAPEWHHYAITFADGGTLLFYIDGVAQTAVTGLGTWSGTFASDLMCLGAASTAAADPFNGWMSHFVWNHAIFTADEMRELAKAGL
jgi:hypothetical protein